MKSGIASSQTKIDAHYTQAGDICVPPSAELSPKKNARNCGHFSKQFFITFY